MAGLSPLGIFHTLAGLVALVYGVIALLRHQQITPHDRAGRIYLWATLVTAVTALGIFAHGGFGPPHGLALLTLAALAVGTAAARTRVFGVASAYVQVVSYTTTLLFHMIPGVTETSTRLPLGAPLLPSAEAPELKAVVGVLFLLYLAGLAWQIRWLRARKIS